MISLSEDEITRHSEGYIGKLRSDNQGTEYNLFGPGENPDKKVAEDLTRNQYAAICYVNY